MTIAEVFAKSGCNSQKEFAERFNLPYTTVVTWLKGNSTPPPYIPEWIDKLIEAENSVIFKKFENGITIESLEETELLMQFKTADPEKRKVFCRALLMSDENIIDSVADMLVAAEQMIKSTGKHKSLTSLIRVDIPT